MVPPLNYLSVTQKLLCCKSQKKKKREKSLGNLYDVTVNANKQTLWHRTNRVSLLSSSYSLTLCEEAPFLQPSTPYQPHGYT